MTNEDDYEDMGIVLNEESPEEPIEEPVESLMERTEEEPLEETIEESPEEETIEELEPPEDEPTEDPPEDTEDPTDETPEETIEETIEEPPEDEPSEEPTDESEESPEEEPTEDPEEPNPIRRFVKNLSGGKGATRRRPKTSSEPDPDSILGHIKRWKMVTFDGYVILKTLTRDERYEEFQMDTTLIKRKDLPRKAVAVTGARNTYCLDKVKDSIWYYQNHDKTNLDPREAAFTASDACLFMLSDKLDNALLINWTPKEESPFDIKKILLLAGLGIMVIVLVMMLR